MRILFNSWPAAGHLLPLLPLADAAADAGHQVAFLSGAEMAGYLGARTLLPAGPETASMSAEADRRCGGGDSRHAGAAAVELFTGVRLDLAFDAALDQARRFAPDLLVCEGLDLVGSFVAAALDRPWAEYAITAPMPGPFVAAIRERAAAEYTARGLRSRERFALIDPLPEVLRSAVDPPPPEDRIAIRPVAHRGELADEALADDALADDALADEAGRDLPTGRPLVLVTAGTSVREPELLAGLVASVADAGYEAAVTVESGTLPEDPRVHELGFVPLARLLPAVDAVVGTAGMGTVLATLASGLPAVLRPMMADQPWNAYRVVAAGAGITIDDPAEAGPAVRTVLTDPAYREAAKAAAESIRSMPSPAAVVSRLLDRA